MAYPLHLEMATAGLALRKQGKFSKLSARTPEVLPSPSLV
jgi:hypothetical protein